MATMKDVARAAGVSQATVSRVVSGNPSVNPEIKIKVLEWIEKLDYHPNIIAQSLVGNRSFLIGVIINNIANPFFSDIIKSVESEALKFGYSIILCNTDDNIEKEKKYISILKSYKVDGILMVPSDSEYEHYINLKQDGIPVVVITQNVPGFSSVSISHYNGGKAVGKHLISMGYSKFVFLGKPEDEKYRGFSDELKSSGIDIEKDLLAINDRQQHEKIYSELQAFLNKNEKYEGLGVFALNDVGALVILHILKDLNVTVPEDAALVGFDNTFISKEISPALSSVAQPVEEIGKQAIAILVNKIATKDINAEKHVVLEPRLVVRESSAKSKTYY